MKEKVIVIGSGFGGLGAAARLAAQGYQVDIFEKLDQPGGRAYVFERDGLAAMTAKARHGFESPPRLGQALHGCAVA